MTQNQSLNGNRFERRKEETKKKIIRVAMDLFKQQGFDTTTMEQIATEADIAKKTLYNHFSVKEAIISAYIQSEIREHGPEVIQFLQGLPDTRSRLITVLLKSFEWAETEFNKDILEKYYVYRMQTILQSVKNQRLRSGFSSVLAYIIRLGQETGEIRQDIPAEDLANHLDWVRTSVLMTWLADPEKCSMHEIINRNIDLFWNGVKSM